MKYLTNEQVLALATKAHEGQFREDGKPYITHPIAVAEIATKNLDKDSVFYDEVYQTAILHDVLEDTSETAKSLIDGGVHPNVVASLNYLNKNNYDSYADMIRRISIYAPRSARIVKFADLVHNSSDLPKSSRKDKYELAKLIIRESL